MNNKIPEVHFERPIHAKVLRAEVATHYLALFNGDRLHRAVEQGVRAARAWCDAQGIAYTPSDRSDFYDAEQTGLLWMRFRDVASQLVGARADPDGGGRGPGPLRGAVRREPVGRRGAQGAHLRHRSERPVGCPPREVGISGWVRQPGSRAVPGPPDRRSGGSP